MKAILTFCFLFLLTACLYAQKQPDSIAVRFSNFINKEDLSKHLHVLASDAYLGRETGKTGQKMAAKYIADYFKSINLPAIGEKSSYFQVFNVIEQKSSGKLKIAADNFTFLDDFYFFPGLSDTIITANELLFLGYGIDDKKYSDYSGQNVKDKVLVVLSGEPRDKKGKSLITRSNKSSVWSMDMRKKMNLAKEKGARALVIIQDHYEQSLEYLKHYIESPTMRLEIEKQERKERKPFPMIFISPKLSEQLLARDELMVIKSKISKSKKPIAKKINQYFTLQIFKNEETLSAENVLGYIEGSDLKDELIIISAHYDHIGASEGKVFNGADDDGSGTVAIMEIAEAFQRAAEAGYRPRRSILILPVSGEEKGLLGSYYYSENPVFPLSKTVANLNIDMIGRRDSFHLDNPNYVYLIGSDILSKELHQISEDANANYIHIDLDYRFNNLNDPNRFYYRSDHYNFAKKNIPVIFYFNGVHADYHKETDEVEKIEFEKMEKITRLVFFTAWELANRTERIKLNK